MKITPEIVRELLHYDPETGIFTWRERDARWFKESMYCKTWNTKFAGKRAGGYQKSLSTGYERRVIAIFGKNYLEHRLAWLYMKDSPLPVCLDHKNQNPLDNRWDNILASSYLENGHNQSKRKNNKSGVTGVVWNKRSGKWLAQAKSKGISYYIGVYTEIEDAKQAVITFRKRHGFTRIHGEKLANYHVS